MNGDAGKELDLFVEHLWNDAGADLANTPEGIFKELKRLTDAGMQPAGKQAPVTIEAALQQRLDTGERAVAFDTAEDFALKLVSSGLLSRELVANATLHTVNATIRPPIDPPVQPQVAPVARRSAAWASAEANREALDPLLESLLAEDCWLAPIDRETIELHVLAGFQRLGVEVDAPALDQIKAGITQHGNDFAEGAGIWIENFAPGSAEVFQVVEPFITELPEVLEESLARRSGEMKPAERADLVLPAIADVAETRSDEAFLRAARLPEADADKVAEAIVELFGDGRPFLKCKRVIQLWEVLAPQSPESDSARKRLINDVFVPMASKSGAQANDLARQHLELCLNPPHGAIGSVKGLAKSAPDKKRAKKFQKRMIELGLLEKGEAKPKKGKKKRGFFR